MFVTLRLDAAKFARLLLISTFALTASTLTFAQISQAATKTPKAPKINAEGKLPAPPNVALEDGDSADIPPFAKDIDSDTYLKMRDASVAEKRGLDDLVKAPQLRSQSIQMIEKGEAAVQQAVVAKATAQHLDSNTALMLAQPRWRALGPDPIPNGQTSPTFLPSQEVPVSGRVTAIAVDPDNANLVYVGTAQGGVYRTRDGGQSWSPLMDSAKSLAIGALAIDPRNHNILFVGTGEPNLSADSFFGVGIYIISNAKQTPVLTGPFNSNGTNDIFTGRAISQILVDPRNDNNILVSTSTGVSGMSGSSFNILPPVGVYLSNNALSGSPVFTQHNPQTVPNRRVEDMVMDPANPTRIAAVTFGLNAPGDGGVFVSTAGDPFLGTATWTQTLQFQSDQNRFSANHVGSVTTFLLTSDQNILCTPPVGAPRVVAGVLRKSINAGLTWTIMPAASGFCGGQCFYDQPSAIDPSNANNVLIGGASGGGIGACRSGIMGRSSDGGLTFAPSQNFLHADSHATAYAPNNPSIVYAGDDGGIFRSTDGGQTWSSINTTGFFATQFESLPVHPQIPRFTIGGTQDNGTELRDRNGIWHRADFGDGGFSAIDSNSTTVENTLLYHTYFNQTNNLLGYAVLYGAQNAFEFNWGFSGCGSGVPGNNGIICTDSVLFYAPTVLGPGNPNSVYYATDRLYRSGDFGNTNVPVSPQFIPGVPISAVAISKQDDNERVVGLRAGGFVLATVDGVNWFNVTGPWAAKYIARIAIDPKDKNTAYVTLDGYGTPDHVWKTSNLGVIATAGTPTWVAADSGIPDVPVNAFAVDPKNSSFLYAGTDIGVFISQDAGATWAPYGTGLPRVAVFDLNVQPQTGEVRVGTHGRGAWEISTLVP